MGKYLKSLQNDLKLKETIPNSKFLNEIFNSGLINKENIENVNKKGLFNKYEEYKNYKPKTLNKDNNNFNQFKKKNLINLDLNQAFKSDEFNNLNLDEFKNKFQFHKEFNTLLN